MTKKTEISLAEKHLELAQKAINQRDQITLDFFDALAGIQDDLGTATEMIEAGADQDAVEFLNRISESIGRLITARRRQ